MSLRHRHGYPAALHHGLRAGIHKTTQEFHLPAQTLRQAYAPHPAHVRQFWGRQALKGRRSWFLSVLLSITLAGPAPSGSADTSRLRQGCSHPHPAPPEAGCPQLRRLAATRSAAEGLSPPTQTTAPHGARGSGLNVRCPPVGVPSLDANTDAESLARSRRRAFIGLQPSQSIAECGEERSFWWSEPIYSLVHFRESRLLPEI